MIRAEGDEGPVCGHCRHYVDSRKGVDGACYFNPPTPYPVPAQTQGLMLPGGNAGSSEFAGIVVIQARAPVALREIACGQFERFGALMDALEESPGDI